MGDKTAIEWTDSTWNPIGGCSIKSPGCTPCYAQALAGTRLKNHPLYAGTTITVKGKPVFNGHLTIAPPGHKVWDFPIKWKGSNNPVLGAGMPSTIFVGDMSDLFHESRPRADIDKVVGTCVRSQHICQLLTKRPEVMDPYFHELPARMRDFNCDSLLDGAKFPASNLWLGFSAERQKEFDERWPYMKRLAAMGYIVFCSYEPAIGPLVLPDDFLALGRRAQVIAGGMSGKEAPYMIDDERWFRAARNQCLAAGLPFFMKQMTRRRPIPADLFERQFPDGAGLP